MQIKLTNEDRLEAACAIYAVLSVHHFNSTTFHFFAPKYALIFIVSSSSWEIIILNDT